MKRATRPGHHDNLQRHDHRGYAGWTVRVHRRGRLVCLRYFSDLRHGGKRGALERALECRDEVLRKVPPPSRAKRRSVRSKTGVVGVHVVRRLGRRVNGRQRVLRYYEAAWVWPPSSRHMVRRSFAWAKYGRAEAWALALEARQEALRRLAETERRELLERLERDRRRRAGRLLGTGQAEVRTGAAGTRSRQPGKRRRGVAER